MSFLDDIGLLFVLYFRFIFPIIVMYLWHARARLAIGTCIGYGILRIYPSLGLCLT